MRLPQPTDYNEAIQNPQHCFRDADLRAGQVVTTPLGLPRPHAGNFADVYQVTSPGGNSWAVKCFTRSVEGLRQRYQAISAHLRQAQLPFLVDFVYLEEGIRVRADWFPVLKMRWIEGLTLNEFVRQQLDRPQVLGRLAQMWVRLARQLRAAGVAHADLQHGNVLLVAGAQADRMRLRLIDYDGMFVPALAETPSGEVGHPNYQHPQRLSAGTYNGEVDRFAHMVIYTALSYLGSGGRAVWEKYDNGENLLFREQDFKDPSGSELFRALWDEPDPELRRLAAHLLLAGQGRPDEVPLLDELTGITEPSTLTQERDRHVQRVLEHVARRRPRTTAASAPSAPAAKAALPWWSGAVEPTSPLPERPRTEEDESLAAAELLSGDPGPSAPQGATTEEGLGTAKEPAKAEPDPAAPPAEEPLAQALPVAEGAAGGKPPKRARQVRIFQRLASGRAEEDHLTAAAGLLARGRFAVANGMAHSPCAAVWATLLADTFVESRQPQPAPWAAWLPPLQLRWAAVAAEDGPLPPYADEAMASFLGLVVHPVGWLDRRRWEVVAVGDCCLFQVRRGVLRRSFPHARLADLEAAEARIGARNSFDRTLRRQEVRGEGDWLPGDEFYLMNRPLARWFLGRVEEWQRPWEVLGGMLDLGGSPRTFAAWVDPLRQTRELDDEDVALLAVCL
jgi:hypothetical protein